MSGPKVVRVITREELEAICESLLARLDAAIGQVSATIRRNGLDEVQVEKALAERRDKLARLLDQGNFTQLLRQVPDAIEFCRLEAVRLEAKAVAAREAARSRRRRLADTARSLIAADEATGGASSEALRKVAAGCLTAGEAELARYEGIVEQALRRFVSGPGLRTAESDEAVKLAKRLGAGERGISFHEWLANSGTQTDERDARLDKVLAEVEALGDEAIVAEFNQRAARISEEPLLGHRRMLTDSLILDASNASKRLRAVEAVRSQLRETYAALLTYKSDEAKRQTAILAHALSSRDTRLDEQLLVGARAALDQAQAELAAEARRKAILNGLSALGYEVREGMATAWTQNGRLVVRKPNATDYGVELAAPGDASRLQVRLVGSDKPTEARSKARDRDHETAWCSEFTKLRELVGAEGGDVVIERAIGVGVEPVRSVPFSDLASSASDEAHKPLERRL